VPLANFYTVQALLDALINAETFVYKPDFNARHDATRIVSQLGSLAKATMSNLQDLQDFLTMYRHGQKSSDRSPKQDTIDRSHVEDIRYILLKHTTAFQRVTELIGDREDWSKLSPRETPAPPRAPGNLDAPNLDYLQVGGASNVSISAPVSPYQPTVEEVEDTSDEEDQQYVQTYRYVPPEDSSSSKPFNVEAPRRGGSPAPPQVIVRTATDPNLVEGMVDSPQQPTEPKSSPLQFSSSADDVVVDAIPQLRNEGERTLSEYLQPSELPKAMTQVHRREKTVEELQQEMNRLRDEMELLRVSRMTTESSEVKRQKSRRRHRHSVDLRLADDYPHQDPLPSRPRASTTLERPRSYIDDSSSDSRKQSLANSTRDPPQDYFMRRTPSGKSRLSPGQSPRAPPRSPRLTDPQIDKYGRNDLLDQGLGPAYAAEMYGPDPRTSLPTVLESSRREPRSRRNTGTRSHRVSQNLEDPEGLREFLRQESGPGGDFELFGPSTETRPRAGSRAQSNSPNNQASMGPRPTSVEPGSAGDSTIRELPVTLEELFYGTSKRVRIYRKRYSTQIGRFTDEERILDVPIYKGLKPGSKVKFQSEGDETMQGMKDLHFVLMEVC